MANSVPRSTNTNGYGTLIEPATSVKVTPTCACIEPCVDTATRPRPYIIRAAIPDQKMSVGAVLNIVLQLVLFFDLPIQIGELNLVAEIISHAFMSNNSFGNALVIVITNSCLVTR